MNLVLDDRVLSAELRGGRPVEGNLHTTGLWYVRLCQAVVRARGGSLSAPLLEALPAPLRERALRAALELPDHVGLVSLRELAPLMGQLAERHRLNVLAREALAAALALEATLVLSERNDSPRLVEAAESEGIRVSVVATG